MMASNRGRSMNLLILVVDDEPDVETPRHGRLGIIAAHFAAYQFRVTHFHAFMALSSKPNLAFGITGVLQTSAECTQSVDVKLWSIAAEKSNHRHRRLLRARFRRPHQ
jgi:hypothetical protein